MTIFNIKERSLSAALNDAACKELPKPYVESEYEQEGLFWYRGIALVRKCDGTQSYCLVEHRPDGIIDYRRDYGTISPIFGLVSVFPYVVVDMKRFGYDGVSDSDMKRRAAAKGFNVSDCDTPEKLAQLRIAVAIRNFKDADKARALMNLSDEEQKKEDALAAQKEQAAPIEGNELRGEDGSKETMKDLFPAQKKADADKKSKKGRPKKG